jgi:GAF domain-containing protein
MDTDFLINPDLPQTRSELALPLSVRSKLIGVLDVQSTEPEAYQEEDIKILQILADQLALAIVNARLIKDSQRTLHDLEIAYGQVTKQAWEHRLAGPLAYSYNRIDVRPVSILQSGASGSNMTDADGVRTENASDDRPINTAGKSSDEDQYKMTVPILIRGQVLGHINLRRESELAPWNKDDRTLVEDAVVQIASALENARLLEEIRSRARQEQQINVISTQIRSSPTTDSILRNTVRELGNALGAYRTFIQLGVPTDEPGNVDLPTESTDDGKEHRG